MRPFCLAIASALVVLAMAPPFSVVADDEDSSRGKNSPAKPDATRPERFMRVAKGIYSGGDPGERGSFDYLAKLGVRTIVSVDGARPDLKSARRSGLRYVHIPIGYDGVSQHAAASLARVMRETEGPVYIHCHHGRHRGPAAAAIAAFASGRLDRDQAVQVLARAGTSHDYAGLWRAVRSCDPSGAKPPKLVEVADVDSLAASMARIDRAFGRLQILSKAGWRKPSGKAGFTPDQQALLLQEAFRESHRNGVESELRRPLREAEALAAKLRKQLKSKQHAAATRLVKQLKSSCVNCHRRRRDGG